MNRLLRPGGGGRGLALPSFRDVCQPDSPNPVPEYPNLAPHLWQPTSGLPFNQATYVTIPAVAAATNILDFTVPEGYDGVINQMGNNFVGGGFVDGSGDVQWQLFIDDAPYPNFENIICSLGTPAQPSFIGSVNIWEKQRIRLVVNNVAIVVAGQKIGGRLSGWFYPRKLQDPQAFF